LGKHLISEWLSVIYEKRFVLMIFHYFNLQNC